MEGILENCYVIENECLIGLRLARWNGKGEFKCEGTSHDLHENKYRKTYTPQRSHEVIEKPATYPIDPTILQKTKEFIECLGHRKAGPHQLGDPQVLPGWQPKFDRSGSQHSPDLHPNDTTPPPSPQGRGKSGEGVKGRRVSSRRAKETGRPPFRPGHKSARPGSLKTSSPPGFRHGGALWDVISLFESEQTKGGLRPWAHQLPAGPVRS